jgi:uncharacterized short protein YbdD (DUF466 family)
MHASLQGPFFNDLRLITKYIKTTLGMFVGIDIFDKN